MRCQFYILLIIGLMVVLPVTAQQESSNNKLLNLKRAELSLLEIKGEYEMALEARKAGLISDLELSKKSTEYLKAKVEYQRALIEFTGTESRVIVESATKWVDKHSRPHAKIKLLYSARDLESLYSMGIKEDLFPLDFLKEIKDIYISLYSDGYIISEPYQVKISSLGLNKYKIVDFILLKDVESLEISIYYTGKSEKTKVYLLKDSSSNIVTINSSQFSQEVNLGGEATFDLFLERYTRESSVFKLYILGLPQDIAYEFIDPKSNARLKQIKFPEGITSMKLSLKVYLPKNLTPSDLIDKAIFFNAICLDDKESKAFDQEKEIDKKRALLNELKGGNVELEIIPIGIGIIELHAVNLYYDLRVGESVEINMLAKNTGTKRLDNVKIITDPPLNWKAEISPEFIQQLDQDIEKEINLKFTPPANVVVGDYELKIKAEGLSGVQRVEADEKIIRIHVSAKTNILGTILLILALAALIIVIVIFGIKLTRK